MRGESMKGKSKNSTYSTTFGIDPIFNNILGTGLEPVRFYSADFKSAASTIPPPEPS